MLNLFANSGHKNLFPESRMKKYFEILLQKNFYDNFNLNAA